MKRWIVFLGIACLILGGMMLVNSCGGENETTMEEVGKDTQQALQSAADWTAEAAEDVYAQLKNGVENLQEELSGLRAEMPEKEEAQKEWNQQIDGLESRIDGLEQEISELRNKSGEVWEKAKKDIEQSIEEIREEINKLREK